MGSIEPLLPKCTFRFTSNILNMKYWVSLKAYCMDIYRLNIMTHQNLNFVLSLQPHVSLLGYDQKTLVLK